MAVLMPSSKPTKVSVGGALQEYSQHSKGLFLQGNSSAFLMDFDGAEVDFEESGAHTTTGTGGRVHSPTPWEDDFTPQIQFSKLNNSLRGRLLRS